MPSKLTLVLTLLVIGTFVSAEPQVAQVAPMYKCIVENKVVLGQKVKEGQLLFQCNLDIQNADLKYQKLKKGFLKEVLDGAEKLKKTNAISMADFLEGKKDFIDAEEQLLLTEIEITNSKYYSPFDGTVTNIVRPSGSGLGDNDDQIEVTEGVVEVNTQNPTVALICTRWPGILELKVKLGQTVKKGDLLFTSNTAEFEEQKKQAENILKYVKTIYKRNKKLYSTKSVSLYKYALAENKYHEVERDLAKAKLQISQSSCHAPFDGTITKIYRYTGSGNGAGKPVVDITETNIAPKSEVHE
jgi:multidrug resistance efflux pump